MNYVIDKINRGFGDNNNADNNSFYLYINQWYKSMSSSHMQDGRGYVMHVWSTGNIHYSTIDTAECGVRLIFRIML